MTSASTMGAFGLVATGRRKIFDGRQYDKYFDMDQVQGGETELMANGSVYDTLREMKKIVSKTLPQTKAIADHLKGVNTEETCRRICNFIYRNIKYKIDNPLREQLRKPIRTWKDRATGVDCDCYSIFISSILTNLGIPHVFRMAAYKDDFQHVYVVAGSGSQQYIIDPVCDRFNYEVPYKKKHDTMGKVTMLNGPEKCTPVIRQLRRFVQREQVLEANLVPTCKFLEANNIPYVLSIDPDTGSQVALVDTKNGVMKLPTIMTLDQAAATVASPQQAAASPQLCPCPTPDAAAEAAGKKRFPWWWIAIGAGALVLLTGSDQNEVKSGLSGIKKKDQKKQAVKDNPAERHRKAIEAQNKRMPKPMRDVLNGKKLKDLHI